MSDIWTLLLIAAIGIAIGAAIGILASGGRGVKTDDKKVPESTADQLVEVFRLWRDPAQMEITLEMGGEKYHSPKEINSGDQEYLQRSLADLKAWLEAEAAPSEPLPAGAVAVAAEEQLLSPAPVPVSDNLRPVLSPTAVVARALRADVRKPEPPPASIVAQIDAILQEKLTGHPEIEAPLQLKEMPDGSMVVMVGKSQYPDIDSVPDTEVRGLIKESVADWEKRVST